MKTKSMMFVTGAMCFGAFLCGALAATMLSANDGSSATVPLFIPQTFSFQKNLRIGDNNQDVRQLQIILNSDPATQISGTGVGSKGQESTYFGQLTADAVMRFQAKYRKDVLDPSNVSTPTGFVGAATRNELNKIAASLVTTSVLNLPKTLDIGLSSTSTLPASSSSSQFFGALPQPKEPLPRLYTVRPQQIKRGDTFTLVGDGFQIQNTVHIGANVFTNVLPQDSSNISFTIPATLNIPNGSYEVWVENSKGASRVLGQSVQLLITDNPLPAPVVSSVLPVTVSGADTVTVIGTGFTPTGNDIVSGFGTIKNLSSNGTQITFSPKSLLTSEVISKMPGLTVRVDFYVTNANGPSNVFGSVNLKL